MDDKNPANVNGCTPLHKAAENGHLKTYEIIMGWVDDKNPKSKNGWTPLHSATGKSIF